MGPPRSCSSAGFSGSSIRSSDNRWTPPVWSFLFRSLAASEGTDAIAASLDLRWAFNFCQPCLILGLGRHPPHALLESRCSIRHRADYGVLLPRDSRAYSRDGFASVETREFTPGFHCGLDQENRRSPRHLASLPYLGRGWKFLACVECRRSGWRDRPASSALGHRPRGPSFS